MSDARLVSRLTLALSALALAALILAGVVVASRLSFALPSVDALLAACAGVLPATGVAGVAVVAVAVLIVAVGLRGGAAAVREAGAQRRLRRALLVVAHGGEAVTFFVVAGEAPQAFCAGLLRPRVYVSRGALAVLDPLELEAVLAHEEHHRSRRDPLRLAAGAILAEAFFFVPALRRLHEDYRSVAELAADEAAIERTDRPTLAAALLRFAPAEPSGAVGIAPERVDHLLGQQTPVSLPALVLAGSLAALVTLVAAVFASSAATSAVNVPMTLMCTCAGLAVLTTLSGAVLLMRRYGA